jgi:hypothetical protein
MKVPGAATLEIKLESASFQGMETTQLSLLTSFRPRGLWGLAYWWSMYPAHGLLFPAMLRNIARAAHAPVLSGPHKLAAKKAAA